MKRKDFYYSLLQYIQSYVLVMKSLTEATYNTCHYRIDFYNH